MDKEPKNPKNCLWIIENKNSRLLYHTASKNKKDACRRFYGDFHATSQTNIKALGKIPREAGFKAVRFVREEE